MIDDDTDLDPLLQRAVRDLRRPVAEDPDARARVLSAVASERPGRGPRAAMDWLLRPRLVRISPAAAAVAVIAAAVAALTLLQAGGSSRVEAGAPRDGVVQFVVVAEDARGVSLVGDFNDWDPRATPMRPSESGGVWSVMVPLAPGRYTYSFLVDGARWRGDPTAPEAPVDDFGRPSSIIVVAGSRT